MVKRLTPYTSIKSNKMKMTGSVITVLIVIFAFFYSANTEIHFSPFDIKIKHLYYSLGWLLIGIGVLFISTDYRKRGFEEGKQEIILQLEKKLDSLEKIQPEPQTLKSHDE
jgi:O-antigen/teichoic acid export membrane protein